MYPFAPDVSPSSLFHFSELTSPDASPKRQTATVQPIHSAYNPFEGPSSPFPESLKRLIQRNADLVLPQPANPHDPVKEDFEGFPRWGSIAPLIHTVLDTLKAPKSFDKIEQLMAFSSNPAIPMALRLQCALSVPRNIQTHSLLLAFAKDASLDVNLRARSALQLLASVQKYHLLKTLFLVPGLEPDLKAECVLKLVKGSFDNVSQEDLFVFLDPSLQEAYRMHMSHSLLLAWLRSEIAYNETMPLLLRARCALKPLPHQDHSQLFEAFAKNTALPIDMRIAFVVALPSGPQQEALAHYFTYNPDPETRILWAIRLPESAREQALRAFLAKPDFSQDLQYFCASKLKEGPLRQNYFKDFAQDKTFPVELQLNAARQLKDLKLKGRLLADFAQSETLSFVFRLPCILEMSRGELRTTLLHRFAQDLSLDVNFRLPCIAALPKGDLKTDLIKKALRDTSLHLPRVQQALRCLPKEADSLRLGFATTLAVNTLLPPLFRYECAQLLPEESPVKQQLIDVLVNLIHG